jgi:hypothetical protein
MVKNLVLKPSQTFVKEVSFRGRTGGTEGVPQIFLKSPKDWGITGG